MNSERIARYCEKMIEKEKGNNGLFSKSTERIEAFKMVLDFINNADIAKEDEITAIKRIFQNYYDAYIQSVNPTPKPFKYPFTKKEERDIKDILIPHIKREMGANEDSFKEMTAVDFFEAFMQNFPLWWKQKQFNVSAIAKHFKTIYTQIVSDKNKMNSGKNGKPSMQDVLSDLAPVTENHQS